MKERKSHYRRSGPSIRGKRHRSVHKNYCTTPRIDPQLKRTFSKIGVPEESPLQPDPFQLEAIDKIMDYDVLVSAPTGSGKTWIASQAISFYLARGMNIWYASPLKALSNSIYQQFCQEFGVERCGILTGDRKENPHAPVIVGTTEILRNQLYDAMHEGVDIQADLVILDEAHYLSDPDRGVVWEEVLIYLPNRVKLLLLSATLSNAEEISEWLEENRGKRPWIVRSTERPVPLEMLFLFPDGLISPLGGKKGLVPRVKKFIGAREERGQQRRSERLHYGEIIRCLRAFNLLPAIFFLKSRMDCDQALTTCTSSGKTLGEREKIRREIKSFLRKYPHLEGHRQMHYLLDSAVGAHHAGQLPYWKVLIESLMNKGYLEAIFSTSTVAAGVNFPARTVVLVQSDRFNGHTFTDLTATELHQMTGRAGRRGMDRIGFALIVPGIHQDPQLIQDLREARPEPLQSQIHINFSMTLNLLLSHRPEEVRVLLDRSFASFTERKSSTGVSRMWEERTRNLKRVVPQAACGGRDPYEIMEYIQKRAQWQRESRRLAAELRNATILDFYKEYLKPGRLFLHRNGNAYLLRGTSKEKGKFICSAWNVSGRERVLKKKPNPKRIGFSQIKALLDCRIDISPEDSPERIYACMKEMDIESLEILPLDVSVEKRSSETLERLRAKIKELPCEECRHFTLCHSGKSKEMRRFLRVFSTQGNSMEGIGEGLWFSFKKHLRFLRDMGFVGKEDRLTEDGIWASKLRLEQPLLIAEGIRKGAFDNISAEGLAGCLAPFVWDRSQEMDFKVGGPFELKELEGIFLNVIKILTEIREMMTIRGFESPQIYYWPAAALYLWAKGIPWDTLMRYIPIDEGDMASLIVRTADHLRQVTNLKDTHPNLALKANSAVYLIMREPVLVG